MQRIRLFLDGRRFDDGVPQVVEGLTPTQQDELAVGGRISLDGPHGARDGERLEHVVLVVVVLMLLLYDRLR